MVNNSRVNLASTSFAAVFFYSGERRLQTYNMKQQKFLTIIARVSLLVTCRDGYALMRPRRSAIPVGYQPARRSFAQRLGLTTTPRRPPTAVRPRLHSSRPSTRLVLVADVTASRRRPHSLDLLLNYR